MQQIGIGDAIRMRYMRKFLPEIESKKKFKCLDAGAGAGIYRAIVEGKGYTYYGVDIEPRAEFINRADITSLPFKNGFFDVCICIDVIEEIKDGRMAIEELYRVLKIPGSLLLHTPNSEQTHILAEFSDNPRHLRKGYRKEELYNILSDFAVVEVFPTFNILECIAWEFCNLSGKINLDKMIDFNPNGYRNLGWLARCSK